MRPNIGLIGYTTMAWRSARLAVPRGGAPTWMQQVLLVGSLSYHAVHTRAADPQYLGNLGAPFTLGAEALDVV